MLWAPSDHCGVRFEQLFEPPDGFTLAELQKLPRAWGAALQSQFGVTAAARAAAAATAAAADADDAAFVVDHPWWAPGEGAAAAAAGAGGAGGPRVPVVRVEGARVGGDDAPAGPLALLDASACDYFAPAGVPLAAWLARARPARRARARARARRARRGAARERDGRRARAARRAARPAPQPAARHDDGVVG